MKKDLNRLKVVLVEQKKTGKMLYRESDLRAALEKNYVAPFAYRNAEDFPAVYGRR